ncbi:hypothetical protein DPM19_11145 [Actinomadura craniellae]|uniref:Uncharacterized protein n=1 Tax=Actinomadura craniellae TaxID=2231787 RepID=A0A365H811_9ACTN|nr:hypothetical protein [Actinomadura craniellae]RAY15260.1 hypothetical protein DPM19_11145 [Actinomadura craniellae]
MTVALDRQAPDPRVVAARLESRRAGAVVWWGGHTGAWWAMVWVRGRWRLLETITAEVMEQALRDPATWPWPVTKTTRPDR